MFIEDYQDGEPREYWPTWNQYAKLESDGSIIWDKLPYLCGLTDNDSIGPIYVVLPQSVVG